MRILVLARIRLINLSKLKPGSGGVGTIEAPNLKTRVPESHLEKIDKSSFPAFYPLVRNSLTVGQSEILDTTPAVSEPASAFPAVNAFQNIA